MSQEDDASASASGGYATSTDDLPTIAEHLQLQYGDDGQGDGGFLSTEIFAEMYRQAAAGEAAAAARPLRSFEPLLEPNAPPFLAPDFAFALPPLSVESDDAAAVKAWMKAYADFEDEYGYALYEDPSFLNNLMDPELRAARRHWYEKWNEFGLRPFMLDKRLSYHRAVLVAALYGHADVAGWMQQDDERCYEGALARAPPAPQPPNEECFHCRIIHEIALNIKLSNTNEVHLDVIAIPELERIVPEYDEHGVRTNALHLDHIKSYPLPRGWACAKCNRQLTPYVDHSTSTIEDLIERAAVASDSRADTIYATPGGGWAS